MQPQASAPKGGGTTSGNRWVPSVFTIPGYGWLWGNMLCFWGAMSVIGIANGWLVLELTESPLWLGVMAGVSGTVSVLFGLLAGALADRFDRRKLLMGGQLLSGLTAASLGVLVQLELATIGIVLAVAAVQALAGVVQTPARNSLVADLVPRERLISANATFFIAFGIVRIPFAIAGGLFIQFLGIASCYFLVAGAMAVAVALLARLNSPPQRPPRGAFLSNAVEGLRYSLKQRPVRSLLFLSVMTEGFGYSHAHMLPVIARNVLDVGSTGLGYLIAATAAGQLVSNLLLASRRDIQAKGWLTVGASMGYGLFILLFALSPWFLLSLVLIFVAGAIGIAYDVGLVSLLQTIVPEKFRGRVMGAYTQSLGANTLGGFQAGAVANVMGAPFAIGLGGALVVLNAGRLFRVARLLNQVAAANPA